MIVYKSGGRIINRIEVREFFNALPDGETIIQKKSGKASTDQFGYYFGCICQIMKSALMKSGWDWIKTKEDASEYLVKKFLTVKEANEKTGEIIERTLRLSSLNTKQMTDYIEEIHRFASSELGIYIPSPNEKWNYQEI